MRRRRPAALDVPEPLARFVAAEWPGECPHESLAAWYEACLVWLAAGSEAIPPAGWDGRQARLWLAGRSSRRLPFGEFGGGLGLIREKRRLRLAMGPCPREARDAAAW